MIVDESGAPIDVRVQQDAQEFFNVLVDRIELSLKGTKHETLLKDVFGGRLCNQMLCQGGCGSVRERFEDFSNVSLQVINSDSFLILFIDLSCLLFR